MLVVALCGVWHSVEWHRQKLRTRGKLVLTSKYLSLTDGVLVYSFASTTEKTLSPVQQKINNS